MRYVILDVATAPLPDADAYLEGVVRAPATYKDPEKIAAYIAEKTAERLQMAATDLDLARIIGVGWQTVDETRIVTRTTVEEEEDFILLVAKCLAREKDAGHGLCPIVTFGGFSFDLPLLMRRARYLGVDFPSLNLDRYRSPHVDLCELLSDRNPQRRRSLQFYAKRLGWTDLEKPLSGAEEARVPETGRWDDLHASLTHDIEATARLARWCGVIAPLPALSSAEAAEVGF